MTASVEISTCMKYISSKKIKHYRLVKILSILKYNITLQEAHTIQLKDKMFLCKMLEIKYISWKVYGILEKD